ncbi:zinc permease [Ideonella sp. 4Y16]|uniref:Zinc permease n=2 Tax=Ideonella TaxID=36862 RepID=A0A940YH86_9BURK|nr:MULTISPECIES: zinc permease [Ideonella]MBQ0933108.1 zinc permease [Ideonella alba]MBQ0945812.1 zinc permease [Ideonella alba]MBQ0959379.1 zinc permease [Ideonella aquatica]
MNTHATLIMAIPAGVAVAGGALAALWRPSHQLRSLIQHFAAGVILAALAVELLPDIGKEHATKAVVLGAFAAGSLFMYALNLWTERLEQAAQGAAVGLLVATFVDVATDGFIIGAGFAAGGETGTVLALGLSVELLFLGLAVTSERIAGWRIVAVTAALGLTVMGCAVLGSALLAGASPALLAGTLSFSAAALLYLVTEELLMEAHEVEEKPIATLVLFGGFLTFWGIQLMGH